MGLWGPTLRHAPPGGVVMMLDFSRMRPEFIDLRAVEKLREGALGLLELSKQKMRLQVFLVPESSAGTPWAGLNSTMPPAFPWSVSTSPTAAWNALGAPAGLVTSVSRMIERELEVTPLVASIRAKLRADMRADVGAVALALGCTTRTLQRQLREAKTSFRQLQSEARFERASTLLRGSQPKIDAIARECGFAGGESFITWFKAHCGVTPLEWRRRSN